MSKNLKYFEHDGYGNYELGRVFSFGFNGDKGGEVWFEEGCDNYFSKEFTKKQAIEMLQEAISIIKGEDK